MTGVGSGVDRISEQDRWLLLRFLMLPQQPREVSIYFWVKYRMRHGDAVDFATGELTRDRSRWN
jgi:hypothetical protein